MVIKLNCKKSEVVGGITKVDEVIGGITGITRYRSPEEKQAMFLEKMLAVLHEVTFK